VMISLTLISPFKTNSKRRYRKVKGHNLEYLSRRTKLNCRMAILSL